MIYLQHMKDGKFSEFFLPLYRPFAAEQSRGTKSPNMLNKATKFEFSLSNMSQCVIYS